MKKHTPTTPDSMLIDSDLIVASRQDLGERGFSESLEELSGREPILGAYIQESMASLAGKLALAGAPTMLVQGMYNEVLALLLSSVEAQRRGHYALWKDCIAGSLLEKLEPAETPLPVKKPRKGRRKKGEGEV